MINIDTIADDEEAGRCEKNSTHSPRKQDRSNFPLIRRRQHSLAANIIPFHERDRLEFLTIIFGGSALAFNSGFINGCTLLSLHPHPVSHVTGTTSHAGIDLARGNFDVFGIGITLVICFVFGSAITGYWMPANAFQLGRQYGPLFLIGSALLLLACLTSYYDPESNLYFYLASIASGLQNGMTTKYSGSIIRTTHLTGAATDIGLTLGRMAIGDYKDSWKLQVLVPIYLSFFTGGFLSKFAVDKLGKLSLMVNVIIFFSIGLVYSIFVSYKLEISILTAFLGSYRTAGQKLRDATDSLNVGGKMKAAIGVAHHLRSKMHFKANAFKTRVHGSHYSGVSKISPTGRTKKESGDDDDHIDHFDISPSRSSTEDFESSSLTPTQNPMHLH